MKFRKFINCFAYISIVFLAIALLLNAIPNKFGDKCEVLVLIAMSLCVVVAGVYGYFYTRSKEQIAFMLSYWVAIIVIITMLIIKFVA